MFWGKNRLQGAVAAADWSEQSSKNSVLVIPERNVRSRLKLQHPVQGCTTRHWLFLCQWPSHLTCIGCIIFVLQRPLEERSRHPDSKMRHKLRRQRMEDDGGMCITWQIPINLKCLTLGDAGSLPGLMSRITIYYNSPGKGTGSVAAWIGHRTDCHLRLQPLAYWMQLPISLSGQATGHSGVHNFACCVLF